MPRRRAQWMEFRLMKQERRRSARSTTFRCYLHHDISPYCQDRKTLCHVAQVAATGCSASPLYHVIDNPSPDCIHIVGVPETTLHVFGIVQWHLIFGFLLYNLYSCWRTHFMTACWWLRKWRNRVIFEKKNIHWPLNPALSVTEQVQRIINSNLQEGCDTFTTQSTTVNSLLVVE